MEIQHHLVIDTRNNTNSFRITSKPQEHHQIIFSGTLKECETEMWASISKPKINQTA